MTSLAIAPAPVTTTDVAAASRRTYILAQMDGKTDEEKMTILEEFLEQANHVREQADEISWAVVDVVPTAITSKPRDEILAILDPKKHHQTRAKWHARTMKTKAKRLQDVKGRWGNDLAVLTDRIPTSGEEMGKQLAKLAELTGNDRDDGRDLRRRALNSALLHRLSKHTSRRELNHNNSDLRHAVIYAKQMLGMPTPRTLPYITMTTDECRNLNCVIVDGLLTAREQAPRTEAVEVDDGDEDLQMIGANEAVLLAKELSKGKEGGGGAPRTPKTPKTPKDKEDKGRPKDEPVSSTKAKTTSETKTGKSKTKERTEGNVEGPTTRTAQLEVGPMRDCPTCRFPNDAEEPCFQEYPDDMMLMGLLDEMFKMCDCLSGSCRTCGRTILFTEDTITLEPSQRRPTPAEEAPLRGRDQGLFGDIPPVKRRKALAKETLSRPPPNAFSLSDPVNPTETAPPLSRSASFATGTSFDAPTFSAERSFADHRPPSMSGEFTFRTPTPRTMLHPSPDTMTTFMAIPTKLPPPTTAPTADTAVLPPTAEQDILQDTAMGTPSQPRTPEPEKPASSSGGKAAPPPAEPSAESSDSENVILPAKPPSDPKDVVRPAKPPSKSKKVIPSPKSAPRSSQRPRKEPNRLGWESSKK